MELEGRVWKSGRYWLIEVPSLNLMTQGKSKKDALAMLEDAVIGLIECYFASQMKRNFDLIINDYEKGVIGVTSNDNKLLLALSLRRQREMSGSTVREVSTRLGSKSPNAYAQYERGKTRISLDQYERLLQAANPFRASRLRIV